MGEYLYGPTDDNWFKTRLLSELNWKNRFTHLLKIGLEVYPFKTGFLNRFGFGFVSRFSLFKKKNGSWYMKDEDWLNEGNRYNDSNYIYSLHKEGKFSYNYFDIFAKFRVFQSSFNKIDLLFNLYLELGFIYSETYSTQNGLSYFYYYSLTNPVVISDTADGLKYKQTMFLPYIGLSLRLEYKKFVAMFKFQNSFLNSAKAEDWHYNRADMDDVKSVEKYNNLYNYNIFVELGYWVSDNVKISGNFAYFETIKKRTHEGTVFGYPIVALNQPTEMSNKSYSIGVNLTFGF